MKFTLSPFIILSAAALAGCAATTAATNGSSSGSDTYFVREGMVNGIDPAITAIWDMQVEVMDDEGNFDPALMDDGTWAALLASAQQLDAESRRQAGAAHYVAADPDGTLGEPAEGTDFAAIQARLDANPDAYRAMSAAMAEHSGKLVAAAEARDAAAVTQLVNDAQPMCNACHNVFWYPEES